VMTTPPVRWLHCWPETGPAAMRLGRAGDELIAEWVGVATLRSNLAGTSNEFTVVDGAPSPRIQERLREHVAALLRHLRGGITLHASSVARDGIAVAFIGDSGAGKSTLAAQLCADPGVELLSDDAAALHFDDARIAVVPTERNHWLRPDIARAMGLEPGAALKVPKDAARPAMAATRLGAVVALAFDDSVGAPALRRIQGAEAFSALSFSTFRFALDVPDVLRQELDGLARIVAEARMFELRRPRDIAWLDASPRVVAELLHDLSREVVV
jgi:hypothetical protein